MNSKNKVRRGYWLAGLYLICLFALTSCAFPGLAETSAQLPQVSETPQPLSLPPIHFPQDEGAHNDLTEWWYYTGHLQGTDAAGKVHTYGFEFVIFQALRSNLPPVYPAHFAISDITRGQFHYDQRSVTKLGSTQPAAQPAPGIDVQVGNWSIHGLNGHDQLAASMQNYAMNLNLQGLKPATLHNGNGLITYGLSGFSYYYSRTRMAVSGNLIDHNQPVHVTGTAWMDHQWGNFLTLGNGGWDWYSLQLSNNAEIMLYFIRDASGKILTTYASYIDSASHDLIIPAQELHATALGTWKSPTTGIMYPSGWRIQIHDPHLSVDVTVEPLLKDQELVTRNSTGNIYWEGDVSIKGKNNNQAVTGQGYVELTGYAK
jgi:predicted secreted hydrolase